MKYETVLSKVIKLAEKADVSKVKPISFDPFNNAYHVVGEKVGDAWGSGKALM